MMSAVDFAALRSASRCLRASVISSPSWALARLSCSQRERNSFDSKASSKRHSCDRQPQLRFPPPLKVAVLCRSIQHPDLSPDECLPIIANCGSAESYVWKHTPSPAKGQRAIVTPRLVDRGGGRGMYLRTLLRGRPTAAETHEAPADCQRRKLKKVGPDRLELSTSVLSGLRSNHLSYGPKEKQGPWLTLPPSICRPPAQCQRIRAPP